MKQEYSKTASQLILLLGRNKFMHFCGSGYIQILQSNPFGD